MVTSRFHKDEAALQRDTMAAKVRASRNVYIAVEAVLAVVLFFAIMYLFGPLTTSPLFLPIYPAIIAPLGMGAAMLATGAYFRKKEYGLADFAEKPAVRTRLSRHGLVFLVIFLGLALMVLVALPPLGDANLAEQTMVRQARSDVNSNTFIRLQFQGADQLGSYRAEVTVNSRNNVTLDFYLMDRDDAVAFDPATPPANAIAVRENATGFVYKGSALKAQDYVLIINNAQNESAVIDYKVFQRTSDGMSLLFALFFLVYTGITGGWVGYLGTLARGETMPVIAPPVPGPAPTRPPMPGPPQPGMRMSAQAIPPMETGLEPESGGVPMSITCPRCNTQFEVMRGAGPTKIRCPSCGKEGTLAGLPAAAPAAGEPKPARPTPQPYPQSGPAYPAREPQPPEQPAAAAGYMHPQPVPVGGDIYARSAAPPAPAVPPSPYEQLQAMGLGMQEPAIPEAPAAQVAPVTTAAPAAPAPAAKRTIACPRCRQAFLIDKVDGPQRIRCPHCGKEGTIGARKPAVPAAPAAADASQAMPAATTVAPSSLAPGAAAPAPRHAPAQAPRPAIQTPFPVAGAAPAATGAAAPKMISCPACKQPFAVTETRRPIKVKCPNCGKEGVLRK